MSTTTTTTEWFHQFYQPSPNAPPPSSATLAGRPADATVVSTTITTSTNNYSSAQLGLAGPGSGSDSFLGSSTTTSTVTGRLSPDQEGRVSRPARRRSRASRRNPTTLLSTDTTNFRAMVQRYTGGASAHTPFDYPSRFTLPGGLQPGLAYNFNQSGSFIPDAHYMSPASSATIDPQVSHLLQQYSSINASSAASRAVGHRVVGLGLEEEGVSSLSHEPGSDHYSASIGGGENRRGGFMF